MTEKNPNRTILHVTRTNQSVVPRKRVSMLKNCLFRHAKFIGTSQVPMQEDINFSIDLPIYTSTSSSPCVLQPPLHARTPSPTHTHCKLAACLNSTQPRTLPHYSTSNPDNHQYQPCDQPSPSTENIERSTISSSLSTSKVLSPTLEDQISSLYSSLHVHTYVVAPVILSVAKPPPVLKVYIFKGLTARSLRRQQCATFLPHVVSIAWTDNAAPEMPFSDPTAPGLTVRHEKASKLPRVPSNQGYRPVSPRSFYRTCY